MSQFTPPPVDLDAIRARVWEIDNYGGPWYFERDEDGQGWLVGYPTDHPAAGLIATVPDYGVDLAEFIAHARTDVPALLAEVERLRAGEPWETVELRAEIKRLREHVTVLEGAVDGSRISCRQWEKLAADHMLRYEARETYVTQVERELAEASAEIERLRSGEPWEKLFRQRDEAIAERDRLRDQITEAEAVIVRAQDALGVDHPVWVILDDYDGSMDSVHALVRERDGARLERDRYAEVVEAAQQWREMRRGRPAKPLPELAALVAAVDRLTPGDET